MRMQIDGPVVAVMTSPQGGIVSSWTGTSMTVASAADFSRDGGTLTPDGGSTVYAYAGVIEGVSEGDPDVVVTASPAPADWPTSETRIDIWPAAIDVVAEVATEADDTIPAIVPHALRAVLADGVRDADDREWVTVEQRGTQWVVTDVIGRQPRISPSAVGGLEDALAQLREDLEEAGQQVTLSAEERQAILADLEASLSQLDAAMIASGTLDPARLADGSIGAAKIIAGAIGAREIAAKAVTAEKLSAEAVTADAIAAGAVTADKIAANAVTAESIAAGAIDGKVIQGGDIYSPDATSTPRVHLGDGMLEVVRNSDDGPITTIRLGGDSDSLQIVDLATGLPLSSLNPDGSASVAGMTSGGDINLMGRSLLETVSTVDQAPLGVVAAYLIPGDTMQAGNSLLGIAEVNWIAQAGRMYRVVWDGYINAPAGDRVQLQMRMKIGTLERGAVTPGTNDDSAIIASGIIPASATSGLRSSHLEALYRGLPGTSYQVRVLLAMVNIDHNAPVFATGFGSTIYVEDMGVAVFTAGSLATGGGTPYAASAADTTTTAPVRQVRTYTTTWPMTWMTSRRTDGASTGGYLQQGYYAPNYRRSAFGFNGDPAISGSVYKALQGASIQKVELYLKNVSYYYYSGGNANVDASTLAAAPGSIGAITGRGLVRGFHFGVGEGKWITLNSDMWPGLQDGSTRSFVLGTTAGAADYARFSMTDPPKLRITYSK